VLPPGLLLWTLLRALLWALLRALLVPPLLVLSLLFPAGPRRSLALGLGLVLELVLLPVMMLAVLLPHHLGAIPAGRIHAMPTSSDHYADHYADYYAPIRVLSGGISRYQALSGATCS